jgi:SAM-dependent methyltransferase
MTELDLIIDFHLEADRQGPGSAIETLKALSFIEIENKEHLKIADIGCGTGAQTIALAQHLNGNIIAVDLANKFLEKLNKNAKDLGLSDKISTLNIPMDNLPFEDEELDIIWSEGAIYNIGFDTGISQWKRYLKKGGYLAVSELSWITNERPKEIEEYWSNAYPQITTISNKIQSLERSGYLPVAHFILPVYCWLDNYYTPMKNRFDRFLEKYQYSDAAMSIVQQDQEEIRLYEKYKDFYSYGFYIAKKC